MKSIFDAFERELVDAAREQAGGGHRVRRPARNLAAASRALRVGSALAGIAVCVGVIVFFATAVHGRSSTPPGVAAHNTVPTVTAPTPNLLFAPAPDSRVQLPVLQGSMAKTRSVSDFHGKLILVNFFASWCQPCQSEAALLQEAETVLADHDGTVLGISFENSRTSARAYLRTHHLTYPALDGVATGQESPGSTASDYDIAGVPETFLIDRQGTIVWQQPYGISPSFLRRTLPRLIARYG